jgi:hypothetical protein
MMAYTCNPSTQKTEAGRTKVQGGHVVHSETLLQTKQNKTKRPRSLFFFDALVLINVGE